ncbi:uncharacterized protein LOC124912615 isoform X2 [Impatiens glandulifera]|uniref:uncharacterized protein LOC124912615 isoform X2 n=1 Tax=Impatiens glandulifera TaxID=253017 RepID=UPI001FB051E8|nr:uncharacterized protein LOC124912615 isoform X2 [Impatiens glandulifera]
MNQFQSIAYSSDYAKIEISKEMSPMVYIKSTEPCCYIRFSVSQSPCIIPQPFGLSNQILDEVPVGMIKTLGLSHWPSSKRRSELIGSYMMIGLFIQDSYGSYEPVGRAKGFMLKKKRRNFMQKH